VSCPKFIVDSFALRTAAHLAHLTTTSYAQHVALGEFYTALLEKIDTYAEVYMGLVTRPTTYPSAVIPRGDIAAAMDDYLEQVRAEMAEDHGSEALKNILAEIEELTARTLYKLRNLK
jgi:DNA-binding ferritin-like protein